MNSSGQRLLCWTGVEVKKSIAAVTLFLLLTLCVSSVQALIITGHFAPSGFTSDAFGGGLGALDVYTIVADNSITNGGTGTAITAFDLSFYGTFAQVQNATFGTNIPSPKRADVAPFGAQALAQDTHFLPALLEPGPPIPGPTEGVITNGVPGSGLAYGLTSNQVAIAGPDQSDWIAIAQIVVPAGTIPVGTFDGSIAIGGNSTPIPVAGTIPAPEPAAALLAMLCSGCLMLRRERSLDEAPKSM